jgi:putative transposase
MRIAIESSERRACGLIDIARSTLRRQVPSRPEDEALQERIIHLAQARRRFGYRRIHDLLRQEGVHANHKRVLYSEAKLSVRKRRRRKLVGIDRQQLCAASRPNEVWSIDFVMDALFNGRRIKCLTVVDDFTRECLDIAVDFGISGEYVTRVLDRIGRFRGLPGAIRTDQGPEFTSRALDRWAYGKSVNLKLIAAGKPTQNAYIESFNGKFRDECLNDHHFNNLAHARALIGEWRRDYNEERPHSMIGRVTPAEFATGDRLGSRSWTLPSRPWYRPSGQVTPSSGTTCGGWRRCP